MDIKMDENLKIEFSETNRGKEQVNINKKNLNLIFSTLKKNNSKVYRCTEYRNRKNKCKSFIILNEKKEILKYEDLHNHS